MRFIGKKIITVILTLLLVSFVTFFAFEVIPGDPATNLLGTDAAPEQIASLRTQLGLDRPAMERYVDWLGGLLRGDLGISYQYYQHNMTVGDLLQERVPVTVTLGLLAFAMILITSIPIGILGARFGKKNGTGLFDTGNQAVMAIPSFVIGILFVYLFGIVLEWFTPGNYVSYKENFSGFLAYLITPAAAIAIPKAAMVVKFLKSEISGQMHLDYVRTARGKGAGENRILFRHVLKNALMPVSTILGVIVAEILAGSLVVEQVFNLPGMGRALITAIGARDYPVVQAIVMYIAVLVIGINLLVDILYRFIDPRSREAV